MSILFNNSRLLLAVVCLFAVPITSSAAQIDTLVMSAGYWAGGDSDLNNLGAVVSGASLWDNGSTILIPNAFGGSYVRSTALNDSKQVVGWASITGDKSSDAFIYQNGVTTRLWGKGEAHGINNAGQVVGSGLVTDTDGAIRSHALLWQNGAAVILPDLLTGYNKRSIAYDINNSGRIIGYSVTGTLSSDYKVVTWYNGAITDLGQSNYNTTYPLHINNNNQIVGTIAPTQSTHLMGYFWQNGISQSIVPITNYTTANDINDQGQVVGQYWDESTHIPFSYIWKSGRIINLNKLPNTDYSRILYFRAAVKINNASQIIAIAPDSHYVYRITLPSNLFSKSDDTTSSDETLTGSDGDPSDPTKVKCHGMCGYDAHTSKISLSLNDTPVGYTPSVGPSVFVRLTYSHKTNSQNASPNFFNVGPNWTLNVLSYVQDDPNFPGQSVGRYVAGGGYIDYQSELGAYNGTTGFFPSEAKNQAKLVRIPSNGTLSYYELRFPNGAIHKYSLMDGATTYPRRVFLTEIRDPQSNKLILNYDGQLRLTSIADAVGRLTTFSYGNTNSKLVTQIIDPFGRSAALGYTSGKLTSITDVIGITSNFIYNSIGDTTFIRTLETPYGLSNFSYTEDSATNSKWLEMADAIGGVERIESRPNAPGIQASETTGPNGIRFVNGQYNERNTFYWDRYALTKARQNLSDTPDYTKAYATHWLMNGFGEQSGIVESVKAPINNRNYLFYPDNDYPSYASSTNKPSMVAKVLDDGTTQTSQALTNTTWGQPVNFYDPKNRFTNYAYDNATNIDLTEVWQKTSPNGMERVAAYNYYSGTPPHRPSRYIDAANRTWSYGYNAAGQMTSLQNPLFQTTQYAYDTYGRPTTVTNANNVIVKQYHYPCNTPSGTLNCNLPDWIKDFDGVDINGYQLRYIYDKLDRLTQITYPDNSTELFDYNFPTGWTTNGTNYAGTSSLYVWKQTDRLGRISSATYDRVGNLITKTDPVTNGTTVTTRATSYEYYPNGVLKNLIDANGVYTHWDIDVQSRPTQKIYDYCPPTVPPAAPVSPKCRPTSTSESYNYDGNGRLKTVTDALGQVKTISYNIDDTVASYTYTHPAGLPDTGNVSFLYDSYWPRMTSMTDKSGPNGVNATTSFIYTPLGVDGALKLQTDSNDAYYNQHMGYFYDSVGRLRERWSAESPEVFQYDNIGRLSNYIADVSENNNIFSIAYGYLGQSNLVTSRTVSNSGTVLTSTYGYDTTANDRHLLSINHPGAVRSYSLGYAANPIVAGAKNPSTIATVTDTAPATHPWTTQTWTHSYDKSDRLLSSVGSVTGTYGYDYDSLDNIKRSQNPSYTDNPNYNRLNQVTNYAWWQNFTHDANGNVTSDVDRNFKWDMEGRVLEITFPKNPTYKLTYLYDGLGRRISKATNDNGVVTPQTIVWCGSRPCQLRSGTLSIRRYLEEGEYDNISGLRELYMTDHLGSVRDMVNAATGVRIGAVDYTPYGGQIRTDGIPPHFQYAKLLWEGQAGLYVSATRFYDGGKGRWLNRDSIREAGGVNLYGYVSANPVNAVDPEGTCGLATPLCIGLAFGAAAAEVTAPAVVATDVVVAAGGGAAIGGTAIAAGNLAKAKALIGSLGKTCEGIYEFVGESGKKYIGQSQDVMKRLLQHLQKGKLPEENIGSIEMTPVPGGKLAREIAEQGKINGNGGVGNLENIVNPIGPGRQHLLPPPGGSGQ